MTGQMKIKNKGRDIVLVPAFNGGWLVAERNNDFGMQPYYNGAFTTTADMIAALTVALHEAENRESDE